MKWYKTNYYKPWWNITFKADFPWLHIEQIADICNQFIVGTTFWHEYKKNEANFEWKNANQVECESTLDKLPDYLKCDNNGIIYYFYLATKEEISTLNKDGKIVYHAIYLQDTYMTKYNYKLHLIYDKNVLVDYMSIYQDRFPKEQDNWVIDIVKYKYLSNYYITNNQLIRKECFNTDEEDLWYINFSDWITEGETVNRNVGSETWDISFNDLQNYLRTPNNTGRFRYIVCQPSSIVKTENQKFLSTNTKQSILLIPLFEDLADEILHATNDISITTTQNGAINPFGGNFIGYWESDLPFSFVYGMYKHSDNAISFKYALNKTNDNIDHKVLYYEIPCNYFNKYKLLDYSAYANGFYGRITNMINNADKWNPDTDPSMLAPQYYQEIYDNGMGRIVNDLSKFKFNWNADTLQDLKALEKKALETKRQQNLADDLSLFMTIMFDDQLFMGINHGDMTNTALASFDNTNVEMTNTSIKNNLINSASSNYYANNTNSGLTSVQNRESEQRQSWTQFGLNTASSLTSGNGDSVSGAIGTVIGAITNPIGTLIKGASSIFGIFSKLAQVRAENERKNRELKSNINNIYSAPTQNLGQPFLKGIIPNNGKLFQFYNLELHPYDKNKVFSNLLNMGYPYDTKNNLQVFKNRKYMNVLNIDSNNSYDKILNCLITYDNSNFTTNNDWDEFVVWLNGLKHIYETIYPINVTDWQASNYISNIELQQPPSLKINIESVLTNIPAQVRAEKSLLIEDLKQAHPSIPDDDLLWDVLEIVDQRYDMLILKVRENETYIGTLIKNCINYNAYCDIDNVRHYVFDQTVFCKKDNIVFEDGFSISKNAFRDTIMFNSLITDRYIHSQFLADCLIFDKPLILPENIQSIGAEFLSRCHYFNQPLTITSTIMTTIGDKFMFDCIRFTSPLILPANLKTIGNYFMQHCENFNQRLILPNNLTHIYSHFMHNCLNFAQPLTLPNNPNFVIVDQYFMYNCWKFTELNIGDIKASKFFESPYTLASNSNDVPMYTTGVEIQGTYKQELLERLPNSDIEPYRKLK